MYPNPTTGILISDEIPVSQHWQTLEIINLQGQRMLPVSDIRNQASVTLHLDNLITGIYFIKTVNANGESTQFKLVKTR